MKITFYKENNDYKNAGLKYRQQIFWVIGGNFLFRNLAFKIGN